MYKYIKLIIFILVSYSAYAQALDDIQYLLEQQLSSPQIRWDNIVERKPYWLTNVRAGRGNFIDMKDSEEIVVRLNRDSILRIHSNNYDLNPDMFDVKVSNGSGLYLNKNLLKTDNCQDLLLNVEDQASIVRVALKNKLAKPLQVTFFTSRYENIPQLVFYPNQINFSNTDTRLMRVGHYVPKSVSYQNYNYLKPNSSTEFSVTGPGRFEILSQYIYNITDSGQILPYYIKLDLDGKFYKEAMFIARVDNHNLYLNNQVLSKANTYQIDVPEGSHLIKLTSDSPVYAQIHSLENPGYLLPEINGAPSARLVNNELLKNINTSSSPLNNYANGKLIPSTVRSAMLFAQDNSWKSSGLKVAELADNLWKQRKDDLSLRDLKDDTLSAYTFFRDMLPTNLESAKKLSIDWAIDYKLVNTQDEGQPYKFIDTQTDQLLKQLILGHFIEISPSDSSKYTYTLPELSSDSKLRIIIQRADLNVKQNLYIQFDNKAPQIVTIYPRKDLPNYSYSLNSGLAGLSILEKNENFHQPRLATLGGIFSQDRIPGNLYSAGVAIIDLPKTTKNINIWRDKDINPLKVAIQYRAPKKFSLTALAEKRESEKISSSSPTSAIFIGGLKFYHDCNKKNCNLSPESFYDYIIYQNIVTDRNKDNKKAITGLYNNWLDLTRFLYERYQKFATGMEEVDSSFVSPLNSKHTYTKQEIDLAEHLTARKDWSDAAVAWSQIIKKSDASMWSTAHFKRIEALRGSSEGYLAERSLKALLLNAKDKKVRLEAYKQLLPLYEAREYYYGMEGLITAYFILLGDDESNLETLSNVLIKDDNQPKALDLAIFLKNVKPGDEVIFTALKNEEGRMGIRPGEGFESDSDKHFWRAQELQKNGLYAEALKEFKLAGSKGEIWGTYLKEALDIKKQLRDPSIEKRNEAVDKWLKWFHEHPGPRTWANGNHLVTKFYEAATLYTNTRDSYGVGFIASSKKPLTLKVMGPAKMLIKMRPMLTAHKNLLKVNSWARILIDNSPHLVKVDNHPNQGVLEIVGKQNVTAGLEQLYEFEVSAGEHQVVVESVAEEMLVEPFVQNPLFAITALPIVNPKTYDFVKNKYWKIKNNILPADSPTFELVSTIPYKNDYWKKLSTEKVRLDRIPVDYQYDSLSESEVSKTGYLNSQISHNIDYKSNQYPDTDELNKILYEFEQTKSKALLVKGKKYCYDHPNNYNVNQLCNYFDLLSRWQQILSVDSNPAIILKENDDVWDPEDIRLNLRKNLMTEDFDNNYVISNTSVAVMGFINSDPTTVRIKASLLKLIAENAGDATLGYQIDDEPIQNLYIANADKVVDQEITIDTGKHSLRLFLIEPRQETFVNIKLQERKSTNEGWEPVHIKKKRKYFVATHNEPIKHTIIGPAWVQVHKLSTNGIKNDEDYFVISGKKEIILKSDDKDNPVYYRIFEKIPAYPLVSDYQAQPSIKYLTLQEAPLMVNSSELKSVIYKINDDLPLIGQEDGTWSMSNRFVVSTASDTINGVTVPTSNPNAFATLAEQLGSTPIASGRKLSDQNEKGVVRFMEQMISYRYFDDINRNYIHTDLLVREFNGNRPSYGLLGRVDHVPITLPVTLFTEGKIFTQHLNNRNNYSIYGEVGMRNNLELSRKINQIIELSAFGRAVDYKALTISDSKYPDPDVYSQYIKTHLRGINLSYILNYNPFLDTKLYIGGSYRTGRRYNHTDQANLNLGAEQLINPYIIGLDYNYKRYFKGEGRLFNFNRQKIGGHISFDHWLPKNNYRVEVNFSIARIFDSSFPSRPLATIKAKPMKAWVGSLGATLHLGNGRAYRDFRSSEIKFKKIKERSIPVKNLFKDY